MAQFVNKLRDCMRTVNLTMLLVLNLFFIVTLNLTVVTVLVVDRKSTRLNSSHPK